MIRPVLTEVALFLAPFAIYVIFLLATRAGVDPYVSFVVCAGALFALGFLVQRAPSFSLRGGTREILRGIIARGLGLR